MKKYKFETHAHTAESSDCSSISSKELVKRYKKAGFDGIAITDHLYDGAIGLAGSSWDACIDKILRGYKNAKRLGDKLGLLVVLGVELTFTDYDTRDFLIYGIDEDFLRKNPLLPMLDPPEFYKRYRDELLIIQAHPYRGGNELVFPTCVHGVEVYNGHHWHDNRNEKARALWESNPELLPLSGSDTHQTGGVGAGWISFDEPVTDSMQFRDLVKKREYTFYDNP